MKYAKSRNDIKYVFPKLQFLLSTLISFTFSAFYGIFAIIYHSFWHGSLAIYYTWLALLKLLVAVSSHKANNMYVKDKMKYEKAQIKIYLRCGVILLWIELLRTPSILQMTTMQCPIKKQLILAVITGYYTFIRIIAAAINLVKAQKSQDLILCVVRNVSFVEAMCSILVFSSTIVSTFSNFEHMKYLLGYYAVAISISNCIVATWMIIQGSLKLSKYPKDT